LVEVASACPKNGAQPAVKLPATETQVSVVIELSNRRDYWLVLREIGVKHLGNRLDVPTRLGYVLVGQSGEIEPKASPAPIPQIKEGYG